MKELVTLLYGSQNYKLDTPESDCDFKILVTPSFDDLYFERKPGQVVDYDPEHYSYMDIRKYHELIKKGNYNATEMLFTTTRYYATESSLVADYFNTWQEVYNNGYLYFMWDNFFNSLRGSATNFLHRCGYTNKTIARAYYYCLLGFNILREGFVMNEESWRGPNITQLPRFVRFQADDANLMKYNNNFFTQLLNELKELGQIMKENVELKTNLWPRIAQLDRYNKMIVKEFMYEI